jgi:serine-type D-Ala-D-Ala carboxypeptidase/endopeptidase
VAYPDIPIIPRLWKTETVVDFADTDALVAEYQRRGGQPGLAYGIVRDGELVHTAGLGARGLGGPPPDADTVFRIASMTKSFTASAVLLLRDEGRLALDDPAELYVPELRSWSAAGGGTPVTIRHLLTMTAGFPTDDPWGDRQQGLPLDEFAKFLADGVSFNWVPGTRFEYSNLGYAILGLVIAAVSGTPYRDFVRDRLVAPLGMTRTGYEPPAAGNLALGYRRAPDGWVRVPFDSYGAFAPMGGVFTCVRDLAHWVAGFAAAFADTADTADTAAEGHPLAAASRREMQLPQVPTGWDRPGGFPGDGTVTAYGFGLAVADEPGLGRVAGHGGGYPGFGSYMRWHVASGTGVIALGNSTYARMGPLSARVLRTLLSGNAETRAKPWPQTLTARDAVSGLLTAWDDAEADRLFSPNVALDAPYAERRSAIALVRERIGDLRPGDRPAQHDTPAHCRWWLAGERGTVQVQILLTPERPPRIQWLNLAIPPAPGSPLSTMLDTVLAWLNGTGPAPITADAQLGRRLRSAAAWAGRCALAAYTAGDGTSAVTAELAGEHATLTLSVTIDPASGQLLAADLM